MARNALAASGRAGRSQLALVDGSVGAGKTEIRILMVFDPWRSVVLLVAGDRSGQWDKWYRAAVPRAEQLYDDYVAERKKEMGP